MRCRNIAAHITVGIGSLLLLSSFVSAAGAHGAIVADGVDRTKAYDRVGLSLTSAPFELVDGAGQWWLTRATFDISPLPRLALLGSVGVASVRHSDGHVDGGTADTDVGFRLSLWSSAENDVQLLAGAMLELPTGDSGTRLGGGHFEANPNASVQWQPFPALSLSLALRGQFAFGGDDHAAAQEVPDVHAAHSGNPTGGPSKTDVPAVRSHGSWLAPHADNEVHLRATVGYRWQHIYLAVMPDFGLPVTKVIA